MRYLFICLLSGLTFGAYAQREGGPQQNANTLLDQSFWQNKPGVEAVKAEVAKGNDPAQLNGSAFDPVVLAINSGAPNETIIYLLDQKGNQPNKITHDSRTYLFWAANRGNTEVMEYLFSKGAKVNVQDSHGMSVINFAAAAGQQNTKVYDLCIKNGADLKTDLNHDGANALLLAISNDPELKLTSYFESKGLDIKSKDAAGNTAFDYAARSGNIPVMKALLAKGVKYSDNAMILASQGGRRGSNSPEVFQYLESIGIKPTVTAKNGDNVLHSIARRAGQIELIKYFLGKGVNPNQANEDGNTPFMYAAASNRDTATITLLTASVKDINQANKSGMTALAFAVRGNSPEIVEYLLSKGANANTVDTKGNNLVYYLFESYSPRQSKDFEPKLKLLQSKGVNFATPQKDGNTVYHFAVAKNDLSLVKYVQAFGADVNAKNQEGLTALHKAAMLARDNNMMQYLVSIGAKKDIKTTFNETAYDLASENEYLTKQKVSVDFLK
ncbi:MAG: ankyrin repeat domain-containing protein [Chitinophagaceae bacterium]